MPIKWSLPYIKEPRKYKNVYLAYLDILGFKSLLTAARNSPRKLIKLLEEVDDAVNPRREFFVETRIISDSIILWTKHREFFGFLLMICERIQQKLFRQGCLVRGAIVYGKHFSSRIIEIPMLKGDNPIERDEIIVSPALSKAVTIENKMKGKSVVEVIIDYSVYAALKGQNRMGRIFLPGERKNKNGIKIFDLTFFEYPINLFFMGKPMALGDDIQKEAIKIIEKNKKQIRNGLSKNRKIKDKWRAIGRNFNQFIKILNNHPEFNKNKLKPLQLN